MDDDITMLTADEIEFAFKVSVQKYVYYLHSQLNVRWQKAKKKMGHKLMTSMA